MKFLLEIQRYPWEIEWASTRKALFLGSEVRGEEIGWPFAANLGLRRELWFYHLGALGIRWVAIR
jgi:hypothetical protein